MAPPLDPDITNHRQATCADLGAILISNLDASTVYQINYSLNGQAANTISLTSDMAGEVLLENLEPGTYADFEVIKGSCTATLSDQIHLTS